MEGSLDLKIKNGASPLPGHQEPAGVPTQCAPMKVSTLSRARAAAVQFAFAIVSIGVPFAFWYFGTRYRVQFYIRFQDVPTPLDVFHAAVHVAGSGTFSTNIVDSLRRIFSGFFIALVSGVGLGLLIGRYRIVKQLLMPAIEVLRPIPAIAWVPLSIMLWPTTESSIVFITFIGAFYPILLNTVDGVQSLDGVLLRAGRCLGASEAQLFWHVILPGVLPNIFTGLAV